MCVVRKILQMKILVLEKNKQNRLTLLSKSAVSGKKNQLLLKIKNSTILITFEVISLK